MARLQDTTKLAHKKLIETQFLQNGGFDEFMVFGDGP